MNITASVFLAITILLVSATSYAESFEGEVKIEANITNLVEGDIINVDVFLIDSEPDAETILDVKVIEKGTGLPAEQIIVVPRWTVDDRSPFGDKVWKTSFEFDTASQNLTPETTYYIKAIFEDQNGVTSIFAFTSLVSEKEIKEKEPIKEAILPVREIPSWIKEVFVFYANEQIDDETLLNAIEFLVSEQIIRIK